MKKGDKIEITYGYYRGSWGRISGVKQWAGSTVYRVRIGDTILPGYYTEQELKQTRQTKQLLLHKPG